MILNSKLTQGLIALFTVATVTVCYAQPQGGQGERPRQPPSVQELLKKMDKNGDSRLSSSEAEGPLKREFQDIDKNKDGFLSQQEIKAGEKKPRRNRER